MTERKFLDRQERRARERLRSAVQGVGPPARHPGPLSAFARRHPLLTLCAAVGAGVAVGRLVLGAGAASMRRGAGLARPAVRAATRAVLGF